jgi:glyoxylase-like metal-dependent hydrolase (beta-lactamase superfamily II)
MLRTTVGSIEITALVDTTFAFPATQLFPDADPSAVSAYADLMRDDGAVSMICGASVLRGDGRTVLVDTGNGPGGQLPAELAAAGVAPSEVEIVVFTHLHGDHTGWNIDRETGKPLFANARYWIPRADWEHYGERGGRNWETTLAPLEPAGVVELFEGERALTPSLTLVPTPGHTPGHTSIELRSAGEQAFILGDAVVDEINLNEPDWANMFDGDDPTAIATRHRLIPRLTASGELIVAAHLGASGVGRFARIGDRLRFANFERG